MTIRKRRRERTIARLANQKRLDEIAYEKIGKSMMASMETWDGTICPECHKSVPARAFIVGGDIQWRANCIVSIGTSVSPQYCHRDTIRCAKESAKEDVWKWKMSPMYQEQN